jgi:lysyl-tRNA synthetase class I
VNIFVNRLNKNEIVLGSCCVKRFGIKVPGWRRKIDYLPNALLCARNDQEVQFVKDLMHKVVRYGDLIVTKKQKKWLEDITRHPFRGKIWPDLKPCPSCGKLAQTEPVRFLRNQRVICEFCENGCRVRSWVRFGWYGEYRLLLGNCCKCHR